MSTEQFTSKPENHSKNYFSKDEIYDSESKNNQSDENSESYKRKIVIIEDDRIMNMTIKNLLMKIINLKKLDILVIQCYDGIDLLKEIMDDQKNGNLIDLIITDENMEFMNGTQALSILRDLESKSKVKLPYIVSSTTDQISDQKMNLLSIKKILPKPIDRNSLTNVLKELNYFE